MNRLERLIHRIVNPIKISNEDAWDTVKGYWDDVVGNYWADVDEDLAEELGVTPVALSELLEVHRHTFDYANIGGNSSVRGYDHGDGWFVVEFSDGSRYLYTLKSTTQEALDWMRKYAMEGKGLNSYIMRLQRENYAGRNYKGTITIRPGMETYSPLGHRRLLLLKAFRNTQPSKNEAVMHDTLKRYKDQITQAGPDGLDPVARQVLGVGLESLGLGSQVSMESYDPELVKNETAAMEAIIDGALEESNESFWSGIKDFFAGRPTKVHLSGRDTNLTRKLNSTINDPVWLSRQKYRLGDVSYRAIPDFTPQNARSNVQQFVQLTRAAAQFNKREMSKIEDRLAAVHRVFQLYATRDINDLTAIQIVQHDLNPYTMRFNVKIREPEIPFGPLEQQAGEALTKIEVKQFAGYVAEIFAAQADFEASSRVNTTIPWRSTIGLRYQNKPYGLAVLAELNRLAQTYDKIVIELNRALRQQITTHSVWIGAENLADSLVNYIAKSISNVSSNESFVGKPQASNEGIWGAIRYLFGGNYEDLPKINAAYDEAVDAVKSTYGNPEWVKKRRLNDGTRVKVKGYSDVGKDPQKMFEKVKQANTKSFTTLSQYVKEEVEYLSKFTKAVSSGDEDKIKALLDMFEVRKVVTFEQAQDLDLGSAGDVTSLSAEQLVKAAATFEEAVKYRRQTDAPYTFGLYRLAYTDSDKPRYGKEGTETAKLQGSARELSLKIGESVENIEESFYRSFSNAWDNIDGIVRGTLMIMEASAK